jgi:hypothetical protein
VHTQLDHIAVTAPSLEQGVEYVRRALGVAPRPGGAHVRMGTHNCLLRLGQKLYLEVIAIDPAAPDPGRKRWFGLDHVSPARLATWVARTDDIHAAAWFGAPERMTRGALHWLITVTGDGSMPMDGIAPTLIQWPDATTHPADTMPDLGCALTQLEGFHPQAEAIQAMLDRIGFAGPLALFPSAEKYLVAYIDTPAGPRRLGARTEVLHGSA